MSATCSLSLAAQENSLSQYHLRGAIVNGAQIYLNIIGNDGYPYFLTIVKVNDDTLVPILDPRPFNISQPQLFTINGNNSNNSNNRIILSFLYDGVTYYLTTVVFDNRLVVWVRDTSSNLNFQTNEINPWNDPFVAGVHYQLIGNDGQTANWLTYVADLDPPPASGQQPNDIQHINCTNQTANRNNVAINTQLLLPTTSMHTGQDYIRTANNPWHSNNLNIDSNSLDEKWWRRLENSQSLRNLQGLFNPQSNCHSGNNGGSGNNGDNSNNGSTFACRLFPNIANVPIITTTTNKIRAIPITWSVLGVCNPQQDAQGAYQREVNWALSWQTDEIIPCAFTNNSDCQVGVYYNYCSPATFCGVDVNSATDCNGPCQNNMDMCQWDNSGFVCNTDSNQPRQPVNNTGIWQQPWFIILMIVLAILITALIIWMIVEYNHRPDVDYGENKHIPINDNYTNYYQQNIAVASLPPRYANDFFDVPA